MDKMNKIKLVVFNENTLGYILPELPNYVQPLHASVLKGGVNTIRLIGPSDKIRLASELDFEEYRVVFNGYKNNPEEYIFNKQERRR